jgi:hypothetical protein
MITTERPRGKGKVNRTRTAREKAEMVSHTLRRPGESIIRQPISWNPLGNIQKGNLVIYIVEKWSW